jgi:hypothetical protein
MALWVPSEREPASAKCLEALRAAEQWIKEGKNAIKWTRLSCRKFRNNEVRLQLHAPAFPLSDLNLFKSLNQRKRQGAHTVHLTY